MKERNRYSFLLLMGIAIIASCTDFIEIDHPRTDLVRETTFNNVSAANAAVMDMYQQMHNTGFASGDWNSITAVSSLSGDDLINGITFNNEFQQFYDNTLQSDNSFVLSLWSGMYLCIYKANAIIEGVTSSSTLPGESKAQFIGEAKLVRAFCHFYLVNLFGDIPLTMTTDYKKNQSIPRTNSKEVYGQIQEDLEEALSLLPGDFSFSADERVRPNKFAAIALQARVHLYLENWVEAENHASVIIDNSEMFQLETIENVFLANNMEAIWQLFPLEGNALEVQTFLFFGHQLSPEFMTSFEENDLRKTTWTGYGEWGEYFYPYKYKSIDYNFSEYSTVIRLAELYLIRAEARAQQGKLSGVGSAEEDINSIRNRAGLTDFITSDKQTTLDRIYAERRVELFTEWGHRWLDLKRTKNASSVLGNVKPNWSDTDMLYPIPENQILNDPAMKDAQNPGY